MKEMAREKELFRAKEEDFQSLLDFKKSIKGQLEGCGSLAIRRDWNTGEYVLVYSKKSFVAHILESAAKMAPLMEDFDRYLMEEVRA